MSDERDPPVVSILVPVFDGAQYLRESLDSILAQTFPSYEVIVLDDSSTDDTPDVIASYGSAVRSHRQEQNRGIYENVNTGIRMAQGRLIAVYHADDVYNPTMVEREVAFLDRYTEAGAVFCLDTWIDPKGREYGRLEIPAELRRHDPIPFADVFNALLRYKNIFLVCPTSMVRTSVYKELGGYRQTLFRNSSDLDMWIRIARRYPLGIVQEYLMKYRHFHGSSSHRYHHMRTDPNRFFEIMDHHLEAGARDVTDPGALTSYEGHRSEDCLMIAIAHYINGDLRKTREMVRSVRLGCLLRTPQVQRMRLLLLTGALWVLARMPRIPVMARIFHRRWHEKEAVAT